jgi:hypothetical protein
MAKIVGFGMLLVAALSLVLAFVVGSTMMDLAQLGIPKPTAKLEILVLILCGVVAPIGFAAILLKKDK